MCQKKPGFDFFLLAMYLNKEKSMANHCISCRVELTDSNTYHNSSYRSYSCKACQNKARNAKRKKIACVNRKTVQAVLATKTCCICNRPDELFFLLKKRVTHYTLKELQVLDTVHLYCLVNNNNIYRPKKTG